MILKLSRKATGIFGLLGIGAISIGIIISSVAFQGSTGEKYSFLNHFVSELGEYANSDLAIVFNFGLFVGGLLLLRFMLGLANYISGGFGWLIGISGVVISLSGAAVGIFSMDTLDPHFRAAMTFFYTGLFITMAFSAYLIFFDQGKFFPKGLAFPGVLTAVTLFYFLFLTEPIVPEDIPKEDISKIFENRPVIWETAIFEWIVVFSIIIWTLFISIHFLRNKNQYF